MIRLENWKKKKNPEQAVHEEKDLVDDPLNLRRLHGEFKLRMAGSDFKPQDKKEFSITDFPVLECLIF